VDGRGSFQNSTGLKDFAAEMTRRGLQDFVVDLKDCELMDSTFLGTLTGIALKLRPAGSLKVIRPNQRNREVLQNLGLDRIFNVVENTTVTAPAGELHDAETDLPREANRDTIIEAHENLVAANPENAVRFKDVIEFLKQKEPGDQARP
jgi:anti-anti-sigma regulatory factor